MAQPSTLPVFATDSTFTSGDPGVIGTDTKTSIGSGAQAQGFIPKTGINAKKVNWLFYWVFLWLDYLKNLATDAYFLGQAYTWTGVHKFDADNLRVKGDLWIYGEVKYCGSSASALAPKTRTKAFLPTPIADTQYPGPVSWWAKLYGTNTNPFIYTSAPSATCKIALPLHGDVTVTAVRVYSYQAATPTTTTQRFYLYQFSGTTSYMGTDAAGTSTGDKTLTWTGSLSVTQASQLYVVFEASDNIGVGNEDYIRYIEVDYEAADTRG